MSINIYDKNTFLLPLIDNELYDLAFFLNKKRQISKQFFSLCPCLAIFSLIIYKKTILN